MKNEKKLTDNEKKVLCLLLENARSTDSEMAGRIGITPQGVRKIRLKLENEMIQQYRTIIRYDSMGLEVFAIAEIRIIDESVLRSRHIIGAFEVNESKVSHILILGFANVEELDGFKIGMKNVAEIERLYVVSQKGMLHNSPVDLIQYQLMMMKR